MSLNNVTRYIQTILCIVVESHVSYILKLLNTSLFHSYSLVRVCFSAVRIRVCVCVRACVRACVCVYV